MIAHRRRPGGAAILRVLAFACAFGARTPPARAQRAGADPGTVQFRDRTVDLRAHLAAFPYGRFHADLEGGEILYTDDTDAHRTLRTVRIPEGDAAVDFRAGTPASPLDWTLRGFRQPVHHWPSRRWIVLADEANDERWNVNLLDPARGSIERITDQPYVYGAGLDLQNHYVAYVARTHATPPFHACVWLRDLTSGQQVPVGCDTPELTFTWGEPRFRPDGTGLLVHANAAGDRNRATLLYFDLLHPGSPPRTLLSTEVDRKEPNVLRDWADPHTAVFVSDESGYANVWLLDVEAGTSRRLTGYEEDVEDAFVFDVEGRRMIGAVVRRTEESEVFVLDPVAGGAVARQSFPARIEVLDAFRNRALLRLESRTLPFLLDELRLFPHSADGTWRLETVRRGGLPEALVARLQPCSVEHVTFTTFDVDEGTHAQRMLHGYLHTPRTPPPRGRAPFAMIEAFYGGENRWDTSANILCDAGAIVLSPAVRGSEGYGHAFAALNDRDLGGGEVTDLIYAARYLQSRYSLEERAVGLYGGSHGGYETLRGLTMPATINAVDGVFAFGFGVAWYPITDILAFASSTNIPDWVTLEAGDLELDHDKLVERSPVTHPERASGPVLLLHGTADHRVPFDQAERMYRALRRVHKPARLVRFDGQGHGLKGIPNQLRAWRAILGFLAEDARLDPHARARGRSWISRWSPRKKVAAAGTLTLLGLLASGAWAAGRRRRLEPGGE